MIQYCHSYTHTHTHIHTHTHSHAHTNTHTGSPQQISTTIVNITVIDGNDNAPIFFGAPYTVVIPEGTFDVRRNVLTVNATDPDSGTNADFTYSLAGGTVGDFQIDSITVSCLTVFLPIQNNLFWLC